MSPNSLIPPPDIPDLAHLKSQAESVVLLRGLAGGGSQDHITHTLHLNCVRLLDATIRDYQLARHAIHCFHACRPSQFGIADIMRASTHFENCIWHFERFIKHVRALRSHKEAEPGLKALLPSSMSFLKPTAERSITQLRHTLAHLENTALSGKLPPGSLITLLPLEDGLCIAEHTIRWDDLAQWLTDAHQCIEKLATFRQPPASHTTDLSNVSGS